MRKAVDFSVGRLGGRLFVITPVLMVAVMVARAQPSADFSVSPASQLFLYEETEEGPDEATVTLNPVDPGEEDPDLVSAVFTVFDAAMTPLTEGVDYTLSDSDNPQDAVTLTLLDPDDAEPDEFFVTLTVEDADGGMATSDPLRLRQNYTFLAGDFTLVTTAGTVENGRAFVPKPAIGYQLWRATLTNTSGSTIEGPLLIILDFDETELEGDHDSTDVALQYAALFDIAFVIPDDTPDDTDDDELAIGRTFYLPIVPNPPDMDGDLFPMANGDSVELFLPFRNISGQAITPELATSGIRFAVFTNVLGPSEDLYATDDDDDTVPDEYITTITDVFLGSGPSSALTGTIYEMPEAEFLFGFVSNTAPSYQVQMSTDMVNFLPLPYLIFPRTSRTFFADFMEYPYVPVGLEGPLEDLTRMHYRVVEARRLVTEEDE